MAKRKYIQAFGPLAGAAARYTKYRLANKFANSFTKTKNKKKGDGFPISQYHNNRLMYKKTRMPYKKKKAWKVFKKKVQAVSWGATKPIVVYRKNAFDMISNPDGQSVSDVTLFTGFNPTVGLGVNNDMNECIIAAAQSGTYNTSVTNQSLLFKSAHMNITFYNDGETPCYLDLYHFFTRKDSDYSALQLTDQGFSGGLDGTNEGTFVGTAKTLSSFGATPFMSPHFCKINKIIRVTKHLIGAKQSIEFTVKHNKNMFMKQPGDEAIQQTILLGGKSRGMLCVAYGVPTGIAGQSNQYANACRLFCRTERTYKFHVVDVGAKSRVIDMPF